MKSRSPSFRPLTALVAATCLVLSACTAGAPSRPAPSLPEPETIAAALAGHAEIIDQFADVRAIVVATSDRIVFEQYYGTDPDVYWDVQSVTKSVVSTLVGIALEEGLIGSVDDTLVQLLPAYADLMGPAVAGTTLRELLTMTAGFPGNASFVGSRDWVRRILATPDSAPGERFLYSNGTSHLLAAILEEATGMSALAYARSRLFGPLDIDTRPAFRRQVTPEPDVEDIEPYVRADFAWPVDPQGVSTGWWGMKLRPLDMVKIGQLFLDGGRWDQQQVVASDWVDLATTRQVAAYSPIEDSGYGYQWWTGTIDGDEAFWAVGYGGQLIQVVPDRDLVVVTSTELRPGDATSRGIELTVLLSIIEDAVVTRFPAG